MRLVKFHHQRLVFGADGADQDRGAILHRPAPDVLRGIGANGGARQFFRRTLRVVENDARIERDDPLGRGQQRVDIDFLDARLFDDELAEAHENLFQIVRDRSGRGRARPSRLCKMRVCSIRRCARVVLSGRQAEARSRYTSTSWPPEPNRITGPN